MKNLHELIRAVITEIERPHVSADFMVSVKKIISAGGECAAAASAAAELCEIKCVSAAAVGSCESIASFVKSYDFILARNLMAFGLIAASSFFILGFCSVQDIIYVLYGATAYYILLILLSPFIVKKYKLLKERALRNYREKLIAFCAVLIKNHSIDSRQFRINLNGKYHFDGLISDEGGYYFKIENAR